MFIIAFNNRNGIQVYTAMGSNNNEENNNKEQMCKRTTKQRKAKAATTSNANESTNAKRSTYSKWWWFENEKLVCGKMDRDLAMKQAYLMYWCSIKLTHKCSKLPVVVIDHVGFKYSFLLNIFALPVARRTFIILFISMDFWCCSGFFHYCQFCPFTRNLPWYISE